MRSKENIPIRPLTSTRLVWGDTSRLMAYPYKVKLADSLVFVSDLGAGDDFFVQVFSYPELDCVTSIGRRGRGPDEVLSLPCFDIYADSIYLLNPHTMIMMRYALREIAEGKSAPDAKVAYPASFSPILSYKVTPRGLFVVSNSLQRQFVELAKADTIPLRRIELPNYAERDIRFVPKEYILSLWNSTVAYQEHPRIAVNAAQLGDLLEIYDERADGIVSVIGKDGLPDVVRNGRQVSVGKVDGFYDVRISGELIYALYSGRDRSEMLRLEQKGESVPNGCDKLQVYDLTGRLLARYQLDCHATGFDMDPEREIMVFVDPNGAVSLRSCPIPDVVPESEAD